MAEKLNLFTEELDQLTDIEIETRLTAAVWVDDKRAAGRKKEAQPVELELSCSAKDAAWAAVGLAKEASRRANLALTISSIAAAAAIASAALLKP